MIQDGQTGVLSGGWDGPWASEGSVTDKVTRYNRSGLQESLPRLITRRKEHACSSLFIDGKKACSKKYCI